MKKTSFKPNPRQAYPLLAEPHHAGPVRHVDGMDGDTQEKENAEIMALAETITKPANTGARQVRPKPSDQRFQTNPRLRRQHGY